MSHLALNYSWAMLSAGEYVLERLDSVETMSGIKQAQELGETQGWEIIDSNNMYKW